MDVTMSNTDRLLKIQRIFEAGKVASAQEFLNVFEVSRATFCGDLDYLRARYLGRRGRWLSHRGKWGRCEGPPRAWLVAQRQGNYRFINGDAGFGGV